jgi:hypothetical protein
MEQRVVHHRPRHFDFTLCRRIEFERDIASGPAEDITVTVRCPDCDCLMMYRGVGRLRNGKHVYHFECVHSPGEVHSLSVICPEA